MEQVVLLINTHQKLIMPPQIKQALYVLVKALPRVCTERGACRETNTARGKAECCICLETPPECCIFRTHELRRCFNCYISLVRSDSAFTEQQIVDEMKVSLSIDLVVHARDTLSTKELVLQWTWLEIS